ncbi:hypothetical protein LX97_02385 [Nonlabens dokdonensis]|jgi:hypothetical protein|uniref:DUF304 domain-containing protein n=3 Tax=Nonlabens dokdonensis TaxID=328515 RepID=L7W634_NONDD|nr:hypothetical protein DDD_0114 [Nonlabens dokdonensis DSW-6]PZX39019.1 hypothetical protein LX97_02385 [Nonlabens dokdonensis]
MGLALLGLALAAILFFLNAILYSSICALIAITLFYINSFEGFSTRNSVSYSLKSITIKLVGRKTFGFTFKELEVLDLSEKGLYIKSKGMDAVTLSRKRYQDDSLTQLHTILKEKTTSNERR